MKNLIFILFALYGSLAMALPDGRLICENNVDVVGDGYMRVEINEGMLDFTFWESGFGPVKATTAGTNVFSLVEEKIEFSGEGETWVSIYSAFLVYNPQNNTLEATLVNDGYSQGMRVLNCSVEI